MKSLAALILSLLIALPAAPSLAQPGRGHGGGGGGGGGGMHGGPEMRGGPDMGGRPEMRGAPEGRSSSEGRGGPYGGPPAGNRGGYPAARGGGGYYGGAPGGYGGEGAAPGYGGYGAPRGSAAPSRGYGGYPGAPPADRRGHDSLGADWGGQQDEVRAGVRQGRYVGLAQVIGKIRQHTPGRQLDAGLEDWGGRAVYRVRWAAPGGRRTDYIVDAQSGAILHVDGR